MLFDYDVFSNSNVSYSFVTDATCPSKAGNILKCTYPASSDGARKSFDLIFDLKGGKFDVVNAFVWANTSSSPSVPYYNDLLVKVMFLDDICKKEVDVFVTSTSFYFKQNSVNVTLYVA